MSGNGDRFRPIRVLLVEDNPDDVAITERAFDKSAVVSRLIVARDGQEVLDLLASDEPRPDLVLLDMKLPKLSGLEVLAKIRRDEELSTIPVIMLTASNRPQDVLASYRLGANSYIQKPVVFERLTRALEVLGQYWFDVATLPCST